MKSKLILLILSALFYFILTGYDKGLKAEIRTGENAVAKRPVVKYKKQKNIKATHKKVTIATASVTGSYYPIGKLISRIVNHKSDEYKIYMKPKITRGSVYNIYSIMKGEAELAMTQSDRQYHALHGQKEWLKKGPQKDLRSICSLYPEIVTLVALQKSGIKQIKDIRGKRINLGLYGSGHLENARDIINFSGMGIKDIKPQYMNTITASRKLSQEAIDAFFYTVGHPNAEIKEISYINKILFVPIKESKIEALIDKFPYYTKGRIDKSYYPYVLNKEDKISSLAVRATIVTSAKVDNQIVYAVAKEIFENIDKLKNFHPVLSSLNKENIFKKLSAPLHPGAVKYYKEKGIDKFINPALLK